MKSVTRTATGTLRRFRSTLVIAEVALAVILLVGAGLMMNSFVRLTSFDVGFNPDHVLSMQLQLLARKNEPEQVAFAQDTMQRLRALPGVRDAALIEILPVGPGNSVGDQRGRMLEGPIIGDPQAQMTIEPRAASPAYFQTLGLRLVKGRLFTDADTAETEPVVVVSERLAQQAWPGEDPIGKRFLWNWKEDQRPTVIGVVSDVKQHNREPAPLLYAPFNQKPGAYTSLVIRTTTDPLSLAAAARSQILAIDRNVVVEEVMTLEQRLGDLVAQPRFYAVLLGGFALIGMLLAVVGLYGVLSYLVSQMTHEVGIRLALGASPRDIFKLVVGQGMALTLAGVAMGVPAAYALTRFLESLLFNVSPTDPMTFASVSLLLAAVAGLACHIPARRAARVDPIVALRYE